MCFARLAIHVPSTTYGKTRICLQLPAPRAFLKRSLVTSFSLDFSLFHQVSDGKHFTSRLKILHDLARMKFPPLEFVTFSLFQFVIALHRCKKLM